MSEFKKTAATGPIDLSRLLWRQPCRLQEIENDAGDTPAATEERSHRRQKYCRVIALMAAAWTWATYLDFPSIRDSSARDHPALPARCPRSTERVQRRNRRSASKLLPSRPLVFRLVPGCAPGQFGQECSDERFLAGTFRSGFSSILDRRSHHRSRNAERPVSQSVCLRRRCFVHRLHRRTLRRAPLRDGRPLLRGQRTGTFPCRSD